MFSSTLFRPPRISLTRRSLAEGIALGAFLLALGIPAPESQAGGVIDPKDVAVSPDISLVYFDDLLHDHEATVPGDPGQRVNFGPLPPGVDVVGFHLEEGNVFFAIDQTAELNGVLVTPQDVVLTDGNDYELFYKGGGEGVPRGVKIDAVAFDGNDLYVSFDTTVMLGGDIFDDEDLLVVTGGGSPAMLFDGSAEGIPPGLDLDAAHFVDGSTLALSFDGSLKLEFHADDEDAIAFDGSFAPLYDGSMAEPNWRGADLDGLFIMEEVVSNDLIFQDGFESGNTSAWTSVTP